MGHVSGGKVIAHKREHTPESCALMSKLHVGMRAYNAITGMWWPGGTLRLSRH